MNPRWEEIYWIKKVLVVRYLALTWLAGELVLRAHCENDHVGGDCRVAIARLEGRLGNHMCRYCAVLECEQAGPHDMEASVSSLLDIRWYTVDNASKAPHTCVFSSSC